jgi:hypothetical protein
VTPAVWAVVPVEEEAVTAAAAEQAGAGERTPTEERSAEEAVGSGAAVEAARAGAADSPAETAAEAKANALAVGAAAGERAPDGRESRAGLPLLEARSRPAARAATAHRPCSLPSAASRRSPLRRALLAPVPPRLAAPRQRARG